MGTRSRSAVDALIGDRRPRWGYGDAEADTLDVAITLAAARPGAALVRPRFVADLRRRLAHELCGAEHTDTHAAMDRRRLLRTAGVAAAAAVGGAVVDRVGSHPGRPAAGQGKANVADDGAWQAVATASELRQFGVVRFATPATVGFLVRSGGVVRAVSGVCTHQGCLLEYRESAQELECPCHRATFALTGDVRAQDVAVPLAPLPELPARERDGRIEVYLAANPDRATAPKPLRA
jgi:nitrite reductase/ring-hydroxylating ferredoxin subunit